MMICIVCGERTGEDLFCSPKCQKKTRSYDTEKMFRNLMSVRKIVDLLYKRYLASINKYSNVEETLYEMLESRIGSEKLSRRLVEEYDKSREIKKKIGLRSL